MKKFYILTFVGIALLLFAVMIGESVISKNQQTKPNLQEIHQVEQQHQVQTELEITQANQTKVTEIKPIPEETEEKKELQFMKPVEGEIEMNYSPETLIYSKTLGEWKVHNGIDIKAERGTAVKAAEAGRITDISETTDKGIEITISHADGYQTVYSNLSTKSMAAPNQEVEKGQVISGVGNTAAFEYYEPDHLHFEVYKDGKLVDPNSIF